MRLPDGQSESPAEVAQRDSTGPVGVQCLALLQLPQREVDKLPQRGRAVLEVLLGVGVHSAQQLLVHQILRGSARDSFEAGQLHLDVVSLGDAEVGVEAEGVTPVVAGLVIL